MQLVTTLNYEKITPRSRYMTTTVFRVYTSKWSFCDSHCDTYVVTFQMAKKVRINSMKTMVHLES